VNRHLSAALAAAAASALIQTASAQTAPAPAAPPATPAPASEQPAATPAPNVSAEPSANATELAKQVEMQRADLDEQDSRIAALERQLKELKKAELPAKPAPDQVAPGAGQATATETEAVFKVRGYVQSQYEFHQESEDQLFVGGAPMNQNRFLLRRVRLRVERDWKYGGVMAELDANTLKGPAIGLQHAEVSLAYRDAERKPLVRLVMGVFDNPFGREVLESPRTRPFMERSFASREFFPAEPDLGVELMGEIAWFRYSVAAVNGQPLGDRTGYILQDPNSHKDVVGRVGVAIDLPRETKITGGASLLNGKGFRAGTDPTKNTVAWRDNLVEK